MKKLFHSWYFIKENKNTFPILAILFFTILIFITNYKPNLYFSGWDNLHPEFNPLNYFFDKSLFGVWHESYGLGGIIANAPYTEIFRLPFYFLISIFVGEINVRFVWTLFTVFLGGLGFYFFSKKYFTEKIWLSTVVSIFYIINLGSVQNFYTPNESFSHFFASLPWLLLVFFDFVKQEQSFKYLSIKLLIVNVLATPSFYITPIFIVYFLILAVVSLSFLLTKKNFFIHFKKIFLGGLLILISNIYWLLPYQHFVFTGKSIDVSESRTYNINTQDAILRNNFSTDIWKTLQLQGLWLETSDKVNGKNSLIMENWVDYYKTQPIKYLSYIPFILLLFGLVVCIISLRNENRRSILFLFFLSIVSLGSTNPPFGFLVSFIQENVPILKDIFRFSFTKFIVLYSFSYSLLILIFLEKITLYVNKVKYRNYIFSLFLFFSLIVYFPVFTGNFFYSKLSVYFPNEYFEVSELINEKKSQDRVLYVPNSPSIGWTYYDWGYRGSGFLWYLTNSNILDEAFEIHSKYNSEVLSLTKQAFYEGNVKKLKDLMSDYNIKFLLFDRSIQTCGSDCSQHFEKQVQKLKESENFRVLHDKDRLVLFEINNLDTSKYSHKIFSDRDITNSTQNKVTKKFDKDLVINIPAPYSEGNHSYFNFQREGNSVQISPILPLIKKSGIEVSSFNTNFNFNETICSNCKSIIIDNGSENSFLSEEKPQDSFGLTSRETPLIIYDGRGTILENIQLSKISDSLQFCSNIEFAKQASVGWEELESKDGLQIESKGISPCLSYKSQNDFENLTLFNFNYESNQDFYLEIAFIDDRGGKELKFFSLKSGRNAQKLLIKLPIKVSKPEIFFVIRPLSNDKEINLVLKDIKIESSFPKLTEYKIPNKESLLLNVEKSSELSVDYSNLSSLSSFSINPNNYNLNNYKFCEENNKEEVPEKRTIVEKNGDKFFNYESSKGVTCETFDLAGLNNTSSYLVNIVSENINGNPLKACFQNTFRSYCFLERNLYSRDEKFIFNRFSDNDNKILQLTLTNNYVTENDFRENLIKSMDFYYTPISWIKDISDSRDRSLYALNRINPFIYSGSYQNPAIVTNFQSNDSGWYGFCLSGKCSIEKMGESVWSNNWSISSEGKYVFVAIYLPQIYMFLGILGFLLVIITVSIKKFY